MKKYSIIFAVCYLLVRGYLQAQPLYFKNYQVSNGLSNNTINCIFQDKQGFLWFGSRNGLNRFDGKNFKVFRYKKNDTGSIGSSSVHSLCEDSKGNLWVGTAKGAYIYNSMQERFSLLDKIPAREVRYIKAAGNDLWMICDFALYRYDTRKKTVDYRKTQSSVITITTNNTQRILFAALSDGSIEQINLASGKSAVHKLPAFKEAEGLTQIQDIYNINDSLLLIGTFDKVYIANLHERKLKNIFAKQPDIKRVQVHRFMAQNDSLFWVGTENGIYIYNLKTDKVDRVGKETNNPYSLSDNAVHSFCKDREGGMWIGTFFGGVNYFSEQLNNFRKYMPDTGPSSISGNLIHEICRDRYGNMWIGTEDEGLNKIDTLTGKITHYRADSKKGSIAYNNIHGLVACNDELWIGTLERGLDVMDIKTGKVIRHYDSDPEGSGLNGNFIVSLYKTKKNEIIVSTWNGLFKYDRKNDRFIRFPHLYFQVQSVREGSDGMLWIATYGNGVYIFNQTTNTFINLRSEAKNKNSLVSNNVNSLYEDHQGNFWFCTEGGLSKYERNGKFTNYTTEEGLPDNQVYRVEEDESHHLWISSAKGLIRLHPQSDQMTLFKATDGLPTEQFNYNSSYKDSDGRLFFGTTKGMISFKPAAFIKNKVIPPVYITNLLVNNKEPVISASGLLKQSVLYTQALRLPYDSANLSFDIAALSFISPESNTYSYIMEGYDKGWTNFIGHQKIYYNKLPPGSYRFKVKGANNNGLWNPRETVLNILVASPWWSSSWAYVFYVLGIGTVTFLVLRYYLLLMKANNTRRMDIYERKKEREIYNLKLEFFTNLAHEIRTPLTLIKMPLDKIITNQGFTDKETSSDLTLMQKNTSRLIQLTNQLLDFRKAETDNMSLTFTKTDINALLSEVFNDLKYLARDKSLKYELMMPRMSLTAIVDEEALKKIFTNLIHNAIKYAASEVNIKLLPFNSDDIMFNVEFRNDGNKIPADKKEKVFEPFYRMNESDKDTGTGIGLPLSRSLAELHKGTLSLIITEEPNKNLFLLSIPILQSQALDLTLLPDESSDMEESYETADNMAETVKPVILLVEDNKEILAYLNKELNTSYTILKATNGSEALDVIDSNNVQLVITDIMMPVMDGIALCKRIKTDIQYSHIPVIFLTAKNALNAKIEGLETGADVYIEKPFAMEFLMAQIRSILNNRKIIKEYFTTLPVSHLKGINISVTDKDFIAHLNKVIYDNISDIDLNVDELSRLMNMSRPTLYRKIKGLSDLTPNELIHVTRLKKAAEILAEGNVRINEVAMMVGYSIQSNFSRDFHKHFGETPSNFAMKQNNIKK
ncbi:MAG TPA: two-component regulator propeller domain-containing protein [Chitinophagaceae bacterium]|nr:two-component regulator propeller domain-containing protein [Chitinophagaceae bacterium]